MGDNETKELRIPALDLDTHKKIEDHLSWLRYRKSDNTITKAEAAADMLSKAKSKGKVKA